jgi:hypothetical protein
LTSVEPRDLKLAIVARDGAWLTADVALPGLATREGLPGLLSVPYTLPGEVACLTANLRSVGMSRSVSTRVESRQIQPRTTT